ncbi:hypothetical protein EXIGLDRAFT_832660 [Exidia glandulosa HHB12029]|uniref:Uncharacterized protein n=1 Tax=Exidia glandulosa HHB12029 TaxID=1314781 RepID=A0A165LFM2_EXIGL|nr:hypothetical protein EXIGLDRAFT_832660 [Exidia glandulosa HHB12029]
MTSNPVDALFAIWRWYYTTLVVPASDSWVTRVSSTFYVLGLAVIVPMAFITGLDVASWLIMRTMGTISADLPPSVIVRNVASDEHEQSKTSSKPTSRRPTGSHGLNLSITPASDPSSYDSEHAARHMFYGSPGEHSNAALAGDGIFSPIISRAASPEIFVRRSSTGPEPSTSSSNSSSSFVDLGASSSNLSPVDGLRKRAQALPVS